MDQLETLIYYVDQKNNTINLTSNIVVPSSQHTLLFIKLSYKEGAHTHIWNM